MPNLNQTAGQVKATAGKATANSDAGIVMSEALVTAAAGTYTLTIGCNHCSPGCVVLAQVYNGSNTQGDPTLSSCTSGDASITLVVTNRHASQALNGTLKIAFVVFR